MAYLLYPNPGKSFSQDRDGASAIEVNAKNDMVRCSLAFSASGG